MIYLGILSKIKEIANKTSRLDERYVDLAELYHLVSSNMSLTAKAIVVAKDEYTQSVLFVISDKCTNKLVEICIVQTNFEIRSCDMTTIPQGKELDNLSIEELELIESNSDIIV